MPNLQKLPQMDEDGLLAPEVGNWALEKYRRVWYYDQLFSTGMKNRWDKRVYIDLFSGSGCARIRDSGQLVPGSPLLALMVPNRFTHYIFCERDTELLQALKVRARHIAPETSLDFVQGDVNQDVDRILEKIPSYGPGNTLLGFCFADPFSVELDFETIRRLGQPLNMDFLILLALGMDANRNLALYLDEHHDRIERFLGDRDWRVKWREAEERGENFTYFLATRYIEAMKSIGYRDTSPAEMYQVRSDTKNLGLYWLAYFSKHRLGYKLWREVLHYTDNQLGLGL